MGIKTMNYMDIMAFNSEVTGSCTLCNVRFPDDVHVRFLVDCGMYQERANDDMNRQLEFNPDSIDFVLVTHTHVDHIGRIPFIVKRGYRGPIYASSDAAGYLMKPALEDCQRVLQANAAVKAMPPIYDERDVEETMQLVRGMPFFEEWSPHERIKVTFFQNAHVPGAVIILVQTKYEGYESINTLFTGDYNDKNNFFKARQLPDRVRKIPITIVEESTYGITDSEDDEVKFEERIVEMLKTKVDILLLAYSFGRAQDVLYKLKCMQDNGIISTDIPIYLDGRLAQKYTRIFPKLNISERMKEFLPENLMFVDKEERENIISSKEQKIVVTSSGTGSYGPAQFYLPYFLANPNAYIAFTGYTPENTLGNKLQAVPIGCTVKVGGILVKRRAEIEYFSEFSSHARADVLLGFLSKFEDIKLVLVNHGEPATKFAYAEKVEREVNPKRVGILDRDYWFRIDAYGFVKSVSTKFS